MLIDIPGLRDRLHIFEDRFDAGRRLAEMLSVYKAGSAIVIALPAGGIPVAATIAEKLGLSLDVAVVSKITLPWTTEAGFGAVAFDGTIILNEEMLPGLGLTDEQIQEKIKQTTEKVKRRAQRLRADMLMPDLSDKTAVLVDDGIASGITMQAALKALGKLNPAQIVIAVPTAHAATLTRFMPLVKDIYCANVRRGFGFAVADAYKSWFDVDEAEAAEILQNFKNAPH
jgi:putative phosphoribosyl transferase